MSDSPHTDAAAPVPHTGSCHCGAVRFTVTMPPPTGTMACNCSLCGRMGWRLAFLPATAFDLEQGEDALQDYQFGKKHLHHPFCRHCGVRAFGRGAGHDGAEMVAVNLRCVAGVDVESLPVQWYDGASL